MEMTLQRPPRNILRETELFPAEIATMEGYYGGTSQIIHAIGARDKTWATFQQDSLATPRGYETIGAQAEKVRHARDQLARIFRVNLRGWLVDYADIGDQLDEVEGEDPDEIVSGLNASIKADPSDLMLGVGIAAGKQTCLKAAKLEGLYIGKKGKDRRLVLPVVSGQEGKRKRLVQARGVGVYGLFAETSSRGILQIEERKRELSYN